MNPLRIFLLAALILVVFSAKEVDADKEPEWYYSTGSSMRSVSISADGEYIAAGNGDENKVYLFGKDSSTPLWSYTAGHNVVSVAISADGEYIVAGSWDDKVYLFDKDSSTPLWNYTAGDEVLSVAISADGEYIVAGSSDYNVYLFDKDSSTPLWNYEADATLYSVAISADGEYIAAGNGDEDNKVYLFDKDSSTPLWSYTGESEYNVESVAISADGEYIAAGNGDENKVYLFDKDSSTPLWSYYTEGPVYSVAISADGEYVVAGSKDYIYLFDKDSSTPLWNYTTDNDVYTVAISADGKYIAVGSEYGGYLFDKDSSTPLWRCETSIASVAISADGEYIAAVSDDNVYLFDKNIPPTATIDSITPSPARFDAEITFNSTVSDSDGNVTGYEWVSDIDGFLSNDEDFSTTGFSVGNHAITFRVQDNDGEWSEWDDAELDVYSNEPPIAAIDSITPSSARFDAEVTFSGSGSDSDGTIVAYEWSCDIDGFLSDEEDFSITGFSTGYHTIFLRVQDNDGEWSEWDTAVLEIYPNAPPVATINSITPSPARFDAEVTFSGSGSDSDGTVVAYEWWCDIDGFLSDEEDFSITGFSVIRHTIFFLVQDNDGEWSEYTTVSSRNLSIYPNAPPTATIDSLEPNSAERGDEVTFSGSGFDTDGTIVAYLWESSIDGELSTNKDFSSNNLSLGHHSITFWVQDNDEDWSGAESESLWIYAVPVAIAGDDVSTTPTVPVQFSGQGTDEDGTIAKYEWDFDGNGVYEWSSTENGRELNLYNNVGVYTAMLRVTDNDGFTNTDTVVITVTEKKIQIDDEGNVTVTDAGEDEEGIPSISAIPALISIGLIAIYRRK